MNELGAIFTLVAVLLQFVLPRRLAIVPLLLTFAWMTRGQVLELGSADFTVMRIVICAGFLRVLLRGERPAHGLNAVDGWLLVWAAWLMAVVPFHADGAAVFRLGLMGDYLGGYFLARIFLRSAQDVSFGFKVLCVCFVPVAISMVVEKLSGLNPFFALGGVHELAEIRNGKIRASGPYAHPILGGTVGAALMAMAMSLWRDHRASALVGLAAGATMVVASNSSGPILMGLFVVLGLLMWNFRQHMNALRWSALAGVLALAAVMRDPVYFVIAKIDLAGGSTGWHRAQLIHSSIAHLDEWWITGTDRTRHWMSSGIVGNTQDADITNHYLQMGVWGGLPLMVIFCIALVMAFRMIGRAVRQTMDAPSGHRPQCWFIGAALFGYVMSFLSISLFDQSNFGFMLLLAAASVTRAEAAHASGDVLLDENAPRPFVTPSFAHWVHR